MRVDGVGDPCARVMFVAGYPGETFDFQGSRELEYWLWKHCQLTREEVFITHIGRRPVAKGKDPLPADLAAGAEDLALEIAGVQPDVIVPLDQLSVQHLLGPWAYVDMTQGLAHRTPRGAVLPITGPGAASIDSNHYAHMVHGFEALGTFLRGELPYHEIDTTPGQYCEFTDAHVRGSVEFHTSDILAIDTEGYIDAPWCLTFSWAHGKAGLIRTTSRDAIECLRFSIADQRPTIVMHYAPHDLRVCAAMGLDIDALGVPVHDTMQLAYIANLPQSLKPLSYRLARMRMREYSDLIAPHDERVARDWLQRQLARPDITRALDLAALKGKAAKVITPDEKPLIKHAKALRKFAGSTAVDPLHERWERSVLAERLGITEPMAHATLDDVPFEEVLPYACADADGTRRDYMHMKQEYFQ